MVSHKAVIKVSEELQSPEASPRLEDPLSNSHMWLLAGGFRGLLHGA